MIGQCYFRTNTELLLLPSYNRGLKANLLQNIFSFFPRGGQCPHVWQRVDAGHTSKARKRENHFLDRNAYYCHSQCFFFLQFP